MTRYTELHRAPLGYGQNGPLTWVAECRVPREPPGEARLAMARWMIENGSDVHQGGDGPLMRGLDDSRIPMMELLVAHGADVNARLGRALPDHLRPRARRSRPGLEVAARPRRRPSRRLPGIRQPAPACSSAPIRGTPGARARASRSSGTSGFALPDTPVMALHRGRLDLLQEHLDRDPSLLDRRFTFGEVFAVESEGEPGDAYPATPVSASRSCTWHSSSTTSTWRAG